MLGHFSYIAKSRPHVLAYTYGHNTLEFFRAEAEHLIKLVNYTQRPGVGLEKTQESLKLAIRVLEEAILIKDTQLGDTWKEAEQVQQHESTA